MSKIGGPVEERGNATADKVYRPLKEGLEAGVFAPGQRLTGEQVVKKLGLTDGAGN